MSEPTSGQMTILGAPKESWAKYDAERLERMLTNPNNGTLGWWRVIGIRHSAMAKASSAMEAVEKAKQFVDPDWEFPEAYWIAVDLPEVFPS